MIRGMKTGMGFAALVAGLLLQTPARAQDTMKQDSMKQDKMSSDELMQDDKMMHQAKTLFTGKFQGKVHETQGRATVHQEGDGKLVLRLTNFKTSSGPDVHVVLLPAAAGNAKSLKNDTERVELGKMKGNEGDQNYETPAGTDLTKFATVSIYCERFNAVFGVAPLEKF